MLKEGERPIWQSGRSGCPLFFQKLWYFVVWYCEVMVSCPVPSEKVIFCRARARVYTMNRRACKSYHIRHTPYSIRRLVTGWYSTLHPFSCLLSSKYFWYGRRRTSCKRQRWLIFQWIGASSVRTGSTERRTDTVPTNVRITICGRIECVCARAQCTNINSVLG